MSLSHAALATVFDDIENLSLTPSSGDIQRLVQDWKVSATKAIINVRGRICFPETEECLSGIRSRAHAGMPQCKGLELWLCRRIYTDACILSALVQDAAGKSLEAIGTLDYALIIAGAAGESRFEIIHGLIHAFQAPLREASPVVATNDGPEEPVEPLPTTLASSTFPIPRISEPSFLSFQSTQSKAPFIVPGYAQGWPALNEHPWRRASHLRAASGPGRVVPVEVGENYLSDKWNQVIMSWDAFLSSLDFEDQETCRVQVEEIQYLAQHNLFTQMPALEDDIEIPVYAYACLTSDGRVHQPPSNERQLVINSWLGPKGTISPPHTVSAFVDANVYKILIALRTHFTTFMCKLSAKKPSG
ncbi:hypothetical protein D9611_004581 [Ephemerocybe angulata]|uniref:Uncharacterized protein n=1 Tax=Ephemerocybe angulata TaxID=980116 RepID=A0A8H5BM27_9AGAR|nr:hypothetical protein D9611_004581 [Tulosesus angulatus]